MTSSLWSRDAFQALLQASTVFSDKLFGGGQSYRERPTGPPLDLDLLRSLANAIECDLAEGHYSNAAERMIDGAVLYGHPSYMSQQLCFPAVASVFGQFWAGILNQGHAVVSMSPLSSIIEERVLTWGKSRMGLPSSAFGLVTGGGSLATLTALLAARNRLSDWGAWDFGEQSGLRVLTSEYAHYSIARSAAMIGLGQQRVIVIPNDGHDGAIDVAGLVQRTVEETRQGNACIVCLSLGNTVAGTVDDISACLEGLAGIRDKVWIHVDAAHGGSLYHLRSLRGAFRALAHCDSVLWNPHKLMFQTIPLSLLYFRTRNLASFVARHESPYLTQDRRGELEDMHSYTLECSRSAAALKLWMTLHIHGEEAIIAAHRKIMAVSLRAFRLLRAKPEVELLCRPMTNVLCFRFKPCMLAPDAADRVTIEVIDAMNAEGHASIGHVFARGRAFIRLCLMNPETTLNDVRAVVEGLAEGFRQRDAEEVAIGPFHISAYIRC